MSREIYYSLWQRSFWLCGQDKEVFPEEGDVVLESHYLWGFSDKTVSIINEGLLRYKLEMSPDGKVTKKEK